MRKKVKIVLVMLIITLLMQCFSFNTLIYAVTQITSDDLEKIDTQKYPQIKEMIQQLQKEHPNWKFKIFYTGLDWNEVIANEYVGHGTSPRNLVPTSSSYEREWICSVCGETTYDSGKWHCASQKALQYMMDPRNSLNSSDIFQFLELTYTDYKIETIQALLKKYDFWNNESYINAIIEASKKYNVNVYYVIARILQEQGNGSTLVKGEGYNGQYVGVYNVFNIGASGNGKDNVILNGLARAEQEGWTTMEASIDGGVQFISSGYIARGQNTMYLQKFDVDDSATGLYWHQYQQNIMAPQNEGTKLKLAFEECESIDEDYTFIIPVYENMPSKASSRPNSDSSNNDDNTNENLVKCNADPSLRLRDKPNGTYIGEKIYLNEVVTVIERATEKVGGTYWDLIRKSNGIEGYAARETYEDEENYKLYLVPIKNDNTKPDNSDDNKNDDGKKEIIENEKIRVNNTSNKITAIPNTKISDLKEILGAEIIVKNTNSENVQDDSNLATGFTVNDKYEVSVLGDVSGDGQVDARDSLRILKYAVGTYELKDGYAIAADINKDGIIDARDSLRILKYAVDTYKIELK